MKAFDTVTGDTDTHESGGSAPDAAELAAWLLEGRFFTVDPDGAITSWSPFAEAAFGWRRKDVVGRLFRDTLLAPNARAVDLPSDYTGGIDAVDAADRTLRAEFAFVPIKLSDGYEFNSLLQEISARSADRDALDDMKAKAGSVQGLIEGALAGSDDGDRPAGLLVLFQAGEAVAEAPAVADNVVPISELTGGEEVRAQLDRARRDAEAGRVEIRSLEGQLEEARREAQRSRNEADVARQEAADSRDALICAHRETEDARRQVEDARRQADEVRAAAEGARIRSEEAQREADSLREQLREARESVRGLAGRADNELAEAQEREAHTARQLIDTRAELARVEAEVAPLRERYQAAQRDLGALRADLESAHATSAERETLGTRRAAELERARADLEARAAEIAELQTELETRDVAELRAEMEARRADAGGPDHESAAVRVRLDRMRIAFDRAPVGTAMIAPDGRYIEVSAALCELLGHSRDRLLGAEPPAIVHHDDADAHRDMVQRMLAGEQTASRGYRRYVHADGHAMTMRENVALARDDEGRPSLFVVQLEEAHPDDHAEELVVDADVAHEEALPADAEAGTRDAVLRALENDLFELHAQPVLDLRTNAVAQYELLIRMRTEDGRLLLPQAFLGPARRAGLAHSIDRWVIREAIRLIADSDDNLSFEVNLSPEAVHDDELPGVIDGELAVSGIDPGRLMLEVAGATATDHFEETRALAKRLRALGCRFALDDFRSNFGSFRLLRELPLDYLKLDGELVGSLTESRTSQLIVKALVDVAAGTGMRTIAVFVSDDETLQLLRQLGVGFAQGYAVGRPRPAGEALKPTPQLGAGS
ncbi:MAG: hypothetical protein QOJ22_1288 [Thermoleophilaceae bacterium]|nr:hypothetical protein [Thermoleophilaceae bacterium]